MESVVDLDVAREVSKRCECISRAQRDVLGLLLRERGGLNGELLSKNSVVDDLFERVDDDVGHTLVVEILDIQQRYRVLRAEGKPAELTCSHVEGDLRYAVAHGDCAGSEGRVGGLASEAGS